MSPLDWQEVFGRRADVVLEVGSGKGLFLRAAALQHPDRDFLGSELRKLRVLKIEDKIRGLPNARVAGGDVRELLASVPPGSLAACWVNFPDPWPKRRHAGRRLFQPAFVEAVARALRPGGELLAATDEGWWAGEILLACGASPLLENPAGPCRPSPRPEGYPVSIHESKFRSWGRPVYFLRFLRRA